MKKIIFYVTVALLFTSCFKDDDGAENSQDIPACVEALYTAGSLQDTQLLTVRRTLINNEYHFWLNNGFNAFDGTEYFVNESCDTVCNNCGFCQLPACFYEYENVDWEIIWEK